MKMKGHAEIPVQEHHACSHSSCEILHKSIKLWPRLSSSSFPSSPILSQIRWENGKLWWWFFWESLSRRHCKGSKCLRWFKIPEAHTSWSILSFACLSIQGTSRGNLITKHGKSSHNESSIKKSPNHSKVEPIDESWITNFDHIFHFFYLCSKEKIKNVVYSISNSPDILDWQSSIECLHLGTTHAQAKHSEDLDHDDVTIDSSLSLKDHHMIHTLLKISNNLDQKPLHLIKENEDKAQETIDPEHFRTHQLWNITKSTIWILPIISAKDHSFQSKRCPTTSN